MIDKWITLKASKSLWYLPVPAASGSAIITMTTGDPTCSLFTKCLWNTVYNKIKLQISQIKLQF